MTRHMASLLTPHWPPCSLAAGAGPHAWPSPPGRWGWARSAQGRRCWDRGTRDSTGEAPPQLPACPSAAEGRSTGHPANTHTLPKTCPGREGLQDSRGPPLPLAVTRPWSRSGLLGSSRC